jgi:hypothetical protein
MRKRLWKTFKRIALRAKVFLFASLSENLSVKANYYYKAMSISIENLPNFASPLSMPSFPNANDQLYNEPYQSSFLSSSSFLGSKLS